MNLKRMTLTGCLTAGLLLSGIPWSTAAHADTTLSLQKQGSGVLASGVYTLNGLALGGTPAFLTVKDGNGRLYYADQTLTDNYGRYQFQWSMPNAAPDGTYNAEIHIQGDIEISTFKYTASQNHGGAVLPVGDGAYRFTGELNAGAKQAVLYDTKTGLSYATPINNAVNVTLDTTKANYQIMSNQSSTTYLTISVPTDTTKNTVNVPSAVLRQLVSSYGNNAHILVATSVGSFDLPLAAVPSVLLDNVKSNGDGALVFTIDRVDATRSNSLLGEYQALGTSPLLLPVEFGLNAYYGGRSLPIKDFGNSYVRCSLDMTGAKLTSGYVTSAQFLQPYTGHLVPTPSTMFRDAVGHGKLVISRTGPGLYVPIQNVKSFDDTSYTALKGRIHELAAKAIVSGKSSTKFDPYGPITRAEFSTLMVRALGLSDKTGSSNFYDIPNGQWFTEYVNIGSSLGLIAGYTPIQFAPEDSITREQMAALLARSLNYVQTRPFVDTTRVLGSINDASDISGWAREDVALAIQTGILPSTGKIEPQRNATRAESVDMLYNLLNYLKFI
ncbi:S-layer homology domain-containing protein [Tumebacillus sp. ITR2]|uniref:S-layer homology domain-containing protein n=1 Tax=Tumebacillus amylolyticus TaxID=2801339 RepID=A0ABS1J8P9_9BACL|nr:S-layer homology domain-containing protein [Tumebacillus amylolyticus]MBL0386657.1 S-layer homology domain-containing protein [Tumebacillus amylolyticus]